MPTVPPLTHEITATFEVSVVDGAPRNPRSEARCTCGWWMILHGEGREEIQAMHDEAVRG